MQKLVDYFVVVGYEQSETSVIPSDVALLDESDYYYNGGYRGSVAAKQMFMQGRAKIVQRFPSENHKQERRNSEEEESGEDEIGFDSNIHAFCQPHKGWRLYARQEPPTYFVSVLTDIKGQRRLAACLTFLEPFIESSSSSSRHHQNGNGNGNGAKETFGSSASSDLSDSDDLPIVRASNGSSAARPIEPSKLFSPKSLVLVSRLEYPELFKSCLSLIYATYIDRRHSPDNHQLETIISSLLTTTVPAPGTATLHTFSLGSVDGDRHWLQSTASLTVPATGSCVYKLFKEIGIANCLKIVCALMADFKCLFFSRSYTKLYDACRAVEALLFPLKYTGVFVPVLPMCQEDFWEFPAAPTPYIIGVHSTFRRLIEQMHADSLHECVKVDLDGASVVIPQCIEEATSAGLMATHGLPHHLYESTLNLLFSILKPDVLHSDELTEFCQARGDSYFTSNGVGVDTATSTSQQQQQAPMTPSCVAALSESSQTNSANTSLHDLPAASTTSLNGSTSQLAGNVTSPTNTNGNSASSTTTTNSVDLEAIWLDKLIRAVFVRLFAQLFAGYRYCLLIIRINPKPVIGFNKASFLANHGLVDNEFMNRLLDSMSFQRFIEERGPSYRHCDVFDDLYAEIQSQLAAELEQIDVEFRHYSTSSSSSSSQRTHHYQSNSTDYIHNNHHLYHLHHHHHHHHHSQPNHSLVASHIRSIAHKLFKYEYPHTQLPVSFLNSTTTTTTTTTSNNLSKSSVFTRSTKQLQQSSQSVDNKDTVAQNAASKNPLYTHPARSYSKIKLPTLDAFRRIHAETFPHLSEFEMSRLINQNSSREAAISAVSQPKNHLCRPHLVPYGPPIETVRIMSSVNQRLVELSDTSMSYDDSAVPQLIHRPNQYNSSADGLLDPWQPTDLDDPLAISSQSNCARKLETISHYVSSIFENNFKEAKKNLNSAYRALRDPRARLHLCACLQRYVKRNQVILNNEQFEYVVKCLNESLSNDTRFDEHGVAYSILPLTTAFYRKLNNGTVDQCIFTRLQSHDVWSNIQFWEMAFYTDVQRSLRPVYLSNEEFAAEQQRQQQQQQQNNTSNGDAATATQTPATTNGIDGTMTTNRKKQPRPNKLDLNGVIGGEKTNGEEEKNGETNDDENGIGGVSLYARPDEKTALEICGEQMEKSGQISDEQRENYVRNEQGIIRSHVLHYITQMANMKIPLDINTRIAKQQSEKSSQPSSGYSPNQNADTESPGPITVNHRPSTVSKSSHRPSASSSSKAQQRNGNGVDGNEDNGGDHLPVVACENNSDVDSDNESAYEANESNRYNGESAMTPAEMSSSQDPSSAYLAQLGSDGYDTLKFIGKFVDRVCMEGCLSDQQRLALHANLLDVISMQIQMLETVYSESRRVPARCKPKLDNLKPDFMLHGERCVEPTPLRCYLIPDGREEVCGMSSGGHVLLPAEGALYLTNYRLIFRGVPLNDPLMNDAIVTRSFPVASLINKEKKLGNTSHAQKLIAGSLAAAASETYSSASSQLHDGLQMRSATFQLVKVYFDDEVSVEQVDKFRASLARIRYPNSVMEFFCFGWRHPSSVSAANASASASTPGQEMPPTEFYLNGGQQIGMRFTQANSPVGPLQNSIVNYLSNNAQNGVGANSHHQVNNSTSSAATGDYFSATTINIKTKEKHSAEALRHFAKNTLRKAGLMPRGNQRKLPAALLQQQQQGTASQKLQQQQSQMASRTPETMRKSMRHSSQQQQPYSSDFLESYSNGTGTPSNTNGDDENLSVIDENFDSMQPSMTSYQSQTVGGIPMSTNESVSQLERLVENTPAYKDYIRQGLVSWRIDDSSDYSSMTAAAASDDANAASNAAHSSPFRFCVLNMNYQLCRTYPCVFVVPRDTSDECIRKNAKCHRQNRLPLVVWRHPLTKCVLLRSSGFHGKGFIGMLMKTQASTTTATSSSNANNPSNDNVAVNTTTTTTMTASTTTATSNPEQDRYINEIVKLTCTLTNQQQQQPQKTNDYNSATLAYSTITNTQQSQPQSQQASYSVTPLINRRSLFATKIEKAVQTIKNNYQGSSLSPVTTTTTTTNSSYPTTTNINVNATTSQQTSNNGLCANINKDASSKFNTIASVSGHNHIVTRFKNQNFEYDTNSSCQASDLLNESFTSSINSASHLKRGAPLYIICEKSQVKSFRSAEMSSSANRGAGGIGGGSNGGVGGEGSSSSSSNPNRYIFLPVELHEVKDTKNSFKKLCRACVPSAASQELLAEINQHKQQTHQQHQQQPRSLTAKSSFVAKFGRKKSNTQTSLMQQYAAASSSAVASNNGGGAISSGSQPIASANQATGGQTGFFKLLHESKWFEQLKALLDVANMICERMDEGSSVMVALEDGWDLTAQVVALAELMMDPYYRTIEGFCVLVEREWLSMGHRFTRRNNHTIDDQTGFAPIFLQFLDCVYQLVSQHPSAFEFNSFLLEFLAYHSVSNRFRTFLLDSELERVQFGVEKSAFLSSSSASSSSSNQQRVVYHTNVTFSQASSIAANTTCIWQYILKVHYQSARFFNFAYQPSGLCSLRVASDICRLKLWSYYTRENLCTGPMYDLDLLAIGNLNQSGSASNQKQTAPVTTTTTNTSSTNDDLWYPVPIQSAVDYYEQLDPLLPTQYEQLLKQLMRMQNQQQPSTPSGGQLPQVLLNGEHEPLGWKQVWDGYYELAENKLSNEIEASGGETSNSKTTANNSNLLLIPNPVSVTKPYLAVATQQQPVTAGQAAHLMVVPTSSHQQYSGSAVTFASTGSSQSSQSQHSSSAASTHSATPPFPKLRHHHIQHQLQQHHGHESGPLGVKYQHEFELAVFSSSAHICSICSRSIKPRDSSQTVTGVKCRNCTIMGHEHCVTVNQALLNECSGSLILHHQPNTNLATLKDLAEMNKVAAALTTSLPPLDTSSYSMQTSSSCSTTPNSNYSHQQQQQIHMQAAAAMNAASATLIQQPHHYHACKLDTDIGSACVGLNHHQQQQQLNNHHHHHHHNPYHHHNHHHVTDYYTRTDSYGDIDDDEAVVECDDPTHNHHHHHHHLMSESLQQQQQQVEQQNNGGYSVDVDVDVTPSTPYNNYNRTNTSSNYINWSAGLMMNNEHQTYAGYLKKQGALFKQWKERYFVLDSIKHQLRYYDSAQDSLAKGVIDLSDIESINQGLSSSPFANSQQTNSSGGSSGGGVGGAAASSTKKALNIMTGGAHMSLSETEAKSCFEVRTAKRVYAFCASSPQDAYKWVKQLEMCCLDS